MADPIEIEFRAVGAEQAAQSTEAVTQSVQELSNAVGSPSQPQSLTGRLGGWIDGLSQVTEAERREQREQRAFVQAIGEMGSQVTAVTTMVGQLARAVGSQGAARAASLVGSMTSGAVSGAAMGAALGPVGAGLGAVIGGLTPAITAMGEGINSAALNMDYMTERARNSVEPLHDVRDAADEVADAYNRLSTYLDSIDNFHPDWGAGNALTGPEGVSDMLRRFGLTGGRTRGGGGPGATEYEAEDSQARGLGATDSLDEATRIADMEAVIAARDAAVAADQARIEATNARVEAEVAAEEEKQRAILELEREGYEARAEAEQEYQDHLREMADEERDNRKAEYEREHEEAISRQQELMGMGMQASKMLVNAIGDVISGAKSGEEAFLGLLKGFLEMISEYAILSATREFADAIASFASQNYAGGAQHLAAGIAFVGLAAATGIGAAAIQVPSGAQAPARPEPQAAEGGKGGSTTIINWNSPVVTAGTRAELGREIVGMVSEAEAA